MNPIHVARLVLDETCQPLSLRRVPPNLLVGQGAVDYAYAHKVPILPNDAIVSPAARERWCKWSKDLRMAHDHIEPAAPTPDIKDIAALRNEGQPHSPTPALDRPVQSRGSSRNFDRHHSGKPSMLNQSSASSNANDEPMGSSYNPVIVGDSNEDIFLPEFPMLQHNNRSSSLYNQDGKNVAPLLQAERGNMDLINDTVGAIAIDSLGRMAAGSSSGGIGMKYKGRIGPAALVGVGSALIPINPQDKDQTCVAAVTSGTGEHMATTMAASTCASRLYSNQKMSKAGVLEASFEEEAIQNFIKYDFMSKRWISFCFPCADMSRASLG